MLSRLDVVMRIVERFSEQRLFDNLLVAAVNDVFVHRDGKSRCTFQTEARLEERPIQIVDARTGSISMQVANPQKQLPCEYCIRQLHSGKHPHERFPVAHGHSNAVPGNATSYHIQMSIIYCASNTAEIS